MNSCNVRRRLFLKSFALAIGVFLLCAGVWTLVSAGHNTAQTTTTWAVIDAIATYAAAPNLDGRSFALTSPVECNAVSDVNSAVGNLCLNLNRNEISATSALVDAAVYGTEAVWRLELTLARASWTVTRATYTGN